MDNTLISNWNDRVQPKDHVYLLGDFTFRNAKGAQEYLDQLNGIVYFIRGNHDTKYDKLVAGPNLVKLGEYKEFRHNKVRYVLCHYPFQSWNGSYHGSFHLHGHCHGYLCVDGSPPGFTAPNRLDVGVDCHDYSPISLEEVNSLLS